MSAVQKRLIAALGALSIGVSVAVAYYYTVRQRRKRNEADEGIGDEDSIISDSEDLAMPHDLTTPITIAPKEKFQFGNDVETKISTATKDEQPQKISSTTVSESASESDFKEPDFTKDAEKNNITPKKVLILGLDGSGKTSLIETLTKQNDQKSRKYTPTNGFNVAQYRQGDIFLNFMEVGGSENFRSYWPNFLQGTNLLIFVIDGNDNERFDEAKDVLCNFLARDDFLNIPCLLLSNKQDLKDAVSCTDILSDAELEGISSKQLKLTMMDFVCLRDKQESGVIDTLMEVMLSLLN